VGQNWIAVDNMGYLHVYGLPVESFPQTFEQYLINAFFVFINKFSKLLVFTKSGWAFLNLALYLFLFWIAIVVLDRLKNKFSGKIDTLKEKIRNHKHFDIAVIPTVLTSLFISILIFLISVMTVAVLLVLSGYSSGMENANKEISKFVSCRLADSRCSTIVKDGKSFEGEIVAISDKYVAIYDGNLTRVIANDRLAITTKPMHEEKQN
jgi:hypothetical protein